VCIDIRIDIRCIYAYQRRFAFISKLDSVYISLVCAISSGFDLLCFQMFPCIKFKLFKYGPAIPHVFFLFAYSLMITFCL